MMTLSAITLTTPVMLAGAVMVGLPILAHLMNRRSRRRVVFPSVQLLVAAAASQSSLFKMRRWWLLLLRCLAVAAVVLAFAQPAWLGPRAEATGGRGSAVVIVIDQSASIGQQNAGISAAHSIRSDAVRVLDELVPGQDVANIVYATARPYAAHPALVSNVQALRAEIDTRTPTYERADLSGAVALAGQMLAQHAGPRRLVILSDLQASNWAQAIEGQAVGDALPAGTRVTVLGPGEEAPKNLALHGAAVSRGPTLAGQTLRLGVSVTNHSDQPQSASVGLEVDGQRVDRQPVQVEARATAEVSFEYVYDGADFSNVVFTLPGDGLEADNRCYLVLRGQERAKVALITDGDVDEPDTAGYFLLRALAPHGDERDRFVVKRYRSGQASWDGLDDVSAVVVGEVGVLSNDKITAMHRYMSNGGGLIYFCGRRAAVENLGALDRADEAGVLPWVPTAPKAIEAGTTIADGAWRTALLKPFDEAGQLALADIPIGWAWAGGAVDERATALLWYADGTPALVSRHVGSGRMVLANFSVDAGDSDLGKHGLFVALMQGLMDEFVSTGDTPSHTVGGLVHEAMGRAIDVQGAAPVTEGPSGEVIQGASYSIDTDASVIHLDSPEVPGFYTTRQDGEVVAVAAVNIDPRESDLRRVSADRLHGMFHGGDIALEASSRDTGEVLGLHGKPMWGWFLLGGMACLGLEMLLLGAYKP